MIKMILLVASFVFSGLVAHAAPLTLAVKSNPGFKTVKQLGQLSHQERVEYFKKLPKVMKHFDQMQVALRPELFGPKESPKSKKKKSKYGFVFALLNEAIATEFEGASLASGEPPGVWHRGMGEHHDNSCIYGGNVSSYSLDPTLGRYGCKPVLCEGTSNKSVACNAAVFAANVCVPWENRRNATSECERITNQLRSSVQPQQLNSVKATLKNLVQLYDDGTQSVDQLSASMSAILKANFGALADPEVKAYMAKLLSIAEERGDSIPEDLKLFADMNITAEEMVDQISKMKQTCNAPLAREVMDEAKSNNSREWRLIKAEQDAGRWPTVGKVIQKSECGLVAQRADAIQKILGGDDFSFWSDPIAWSPALPLNPAPSEPPAEPSVPVDVVDDDGKSREVPVRTICNLNQNEEGIAPGLLMCAGCLAEFKGNRSSDDEVRTSFQRSTVSTKWLSMMYLVDRSCGFFSGGPSKMNTPSRLEMEKVLHAMEDYGYCSEATYSWNPGDLSDTHRGRIAEWMEKGVGNNDEETAVFANIYGAPLDVMKAAMCGGGMNIDDAMKKISDDYKTTRYRYNGPGKRRVRDVEYDENKLAEAQTQFRQSDLYKCMQEVKKVLAAEKTDRQDLNESELPSWDIPRTFGSWPRSQYACSFSGEREIYEPLADRYAAGLGLPQILSNDEGECRVVAGVTANGEPVVLEEADPSELEKYNQITFPGGLCGYKRNLSKNKSDALLFRI
ncbi:MAG: hypothetical protein R2827_07240 [Bdellovibrionales bacterium]